MWMCIFDALMPGTGCGDVMEGFTAFYMLYIFYITYDFSCLYSFDTFAIYILLIFTNVYILFLKSSPLSYLRWYMLYIQRPRFFTFTFHFS